MLRAFAAIDQMPLLCVLRADGKRRDVSGFGWRAGRGAKEQKFHWLNREVKKIPSIIAKLQKHMKPSVNRFD
jgi:hypothetical protein